MPDHQHTILIVDDHQDMREALETFLMSMGCTVVTASEGEEGLDRLRGGLRPCLILLDLMMPKLDGWQFRQAQLADPNLASIPVIAVSAYYALREQAAASGIEAVLPKPIDPDKLVGLVARYCASG